jgi:asparagine N-glycosylation enzyme membrane subunit Stt3
MTLYASILLTLAAAFGFTMIFIGLYYHRSSKKLAISHALLAITGFGFLGIQIYRGPVDKYNNSAALLLLLALIGGGMLLALREDNHSPSMPLVTIHAILALAGILVLTLGLQ